MPAALERQPRGASALPSLLYTPAPDSHSQVPTRAQASPVFQLQVLFAFLQSSQQAVYDPDPLVEALKIKRTEQQDAQEFSKLFLGLLDYEFKKQAKRAEVEGGDGKIGRIVEEQVSLPCLSLLAA